MSALAVASASVLSPKELSWAIHERCYLGHPLRGHRFCGGPTGGLIVHRIGGGRGATRRLPGCGILVGQGHPDVAGGERLYKLRGVGLCRWCYFGAKRGEANDG